MPIRHALFCFLTKISQIETRESHIGQLKANNMEKIWGKLKEPTKLAITEAEDTKASIRQKVWECMEKNDIANFPRPVYNRIPNFKGAILAGQKVAELEEFKSAKTIKVNPDKPQEEVRYHVLEQNKELIVPTPRLSKGLFNRLTNEPGCDKDAIRKLASREGIDHKSKPIPMASRIKVDLVVVGSVAVDRFGRRIGKGEGFADLEFAMAASHHGAVGNDSVVVTTVHDLQVFDKLPEALFQPHDLTVDIIVTPTEVFRVKDRLSKPDAILWSMLTREKFDSIPILREIQFKEMKAGKNVTLKGETAEQSIEANNGVINGGSTEAKQNGSAKKKSPRKANPKKKKSETEENKENGANNKEEVADKPKKAKNSKKAAADKADVNNDNETSGGEKTSKKSPSGKKLNQYQKTVGVFVGKIPRGTRVKELKDVIVERGVRPVNIQWKGGKGYAMVYCEKKEDTTSESLVEKLKDLKIGDNPLNIEPDKRGANKKGPNKAANDDNDDDNNLVQEEPETNASSSKD